MHTDTISYIPSQAELFVEASEKAEDESPVKLFIQDAAVLFRLLRYLPWLFIPLRSRESGSEIKSDETLYGETILQILLFVVESSTLVLAIPAFFLLPGLLFLLVVALAFLLVQILSYPLSGSSPIYSQAGAAAKQFFQDERWIFLNGCASGHKTLQSDIDCLSRVFGREVIGIHNRTYGLVADILECLIQRCFGYRTTDVRVAYGQIKTLLYAAEVRKVILIGHSQGGITISLVIDELLAELPQHLLTKLEIYTFGSAARHLHSPPISLESSTQSVGKGHRSKLLISHIEHYANEHDMVPRWGVLSSTRSILSPQYAGQVFVHKASGHMFVRHYISAIFESNGPGPSQYLDQVVELEEEAGKRKQHALLETTSIRNREPTELTFGSGEEVLEGGSDTAKDMFSFDRTPSGRLILEARGKTVRQLSRLWRYQGGKSPDDP